MQNIFTFHLPTRIEYGCGLIKKTGEKALAVTGGKKALIVTDPGLEKTGITGTVVESMAQQGFVCSVFNQVKPNPRDIDCEEGGREAKRLGIEIVIAVGGGSVIDAAKAIALLQTHGGPLSQYEGGGIIPGPITPLVAVPTTAGTGSEATRSAVITSTAQRYKMSVKDLLLAPGLALVDPETTYLLPPGLSASTGMDALVHAIEAYTSRRANPLSDALALHAVEKIYPALPVAVFDGTNREARSDMMAGSLMAGLAFSHSDVGAVHCMAEAIGGLYDTAHGVANSIFLPAVTAFNSKEDPVRHARLAEACGLETGGLSAPGAATLLVNKLSELATEIGIPSFKDVEGVDPADFTRLAETSAANGSTPSNCRPITAEDYLELFRSAYNN